MFALTVGGAFLAMPVVLLAQSAANEKNGAESRRDNDASRKFRGYLEEDWKRWMVEYPERPRPRVFQARTAGGVTIHPAESRRVRNICMRAPPR
jgi:hypothetical protein